jgi:single-stranded DNA-binding protein
MNDGNERGALANIAIIRGVVHGDPTVRDMPGGGTVVQFDVSTRVESVGSTGPGRTVSVPIAWNDPTATQLGLVVPGANVTVVGTVRRRFFRVAGATQSRTEVVADVVVPTRHHKRVAVALREAADRILDVVA